MKKLSLLLAASVMSVGAFGCQQDNKNVERKLDELSKAVAALDKKIDGVAAGAGRAGQPGQQQQQRRRPEPDPNDVYAVDISGDPFLGTQDALVTIVKGYDYACPYCEKVRPTMDQLLKDYDGKIKIVAKQFVVHPQVATTSALAACAAGKQGHFKEMDNLIWDKAFATRKFDDANIEALANEIHTADPKFDVARWKADMKGDCPAFIQKDQNDLQIMGQGATPTFYINGRYMSGAQPLPAFKAIIDEELKKAQDRVASGTSAASYYQTWVMEKGLKKFTPKPEAAPSPAGGGQPGQVIQVRPPTPPPGAPAPGQVVPPAKP
jgi:protein-disulfide isomerase